VNLSKGKNFLNVNYQISRYILQAMGNQWMNRNDDFKKRQRALEITAENSSRVLKKLNVTVTANIQKPEIFDRNYFMVCNHMSYIDILVLSSIRPAVFVTSVEMENTFFLGDMAKWGGSFFVNRINRRKMKEEVKALEELLEKGFNVFIFPEGTSTNGQELLPFKKSLFRVPFQTGAPILPICLKYKSIDGKAFSEENCDRVCWYDDMTFAPHFLQLMDLKDMQAEVTYLDPLDPKDFESHGDLSAAAQKAIAQCYYGS
jgi:1-acyl-sn-glycerol-3-phosphate acyltransferase